MQKRGQVTIFIVIGILIILALAVILTVRLSLTSKEAEIQKAGAAPLLGSAVQNYIESCLQKTGKEALTFTANRGGYYKLPELSEYDLPYYLYEDEDNVISREELEKHISEYMETEFFFCIKNFAPFKEAGLDIRQKEITVSTVVQDNSVVFNSEFPVIIEQDTLRKEMAYFSTRRLSSIGKMRKLAAEFTEMQKSDPAAVCVSCLVSLGIEHGLRTEMSPIKEGVVMFTITDDSGKEPQEYKFLNRYRIEEEEEEEKK